MARSWAGKKSASAQEAHEAIRPTDIRREDGGADDTQRRV